MSMAAFRRAGSERQHANVVDDMRVCLVACLLATATMPASAAEVTLRVDGSHGVYHVHGAFRAAVPVTAVWNVLADYEQISGFVHSVRSSAFVRAADGSRVLRQDALASAFPFRRAIRVELALREDAGRRIAFHDVLGRDFRHYAGSWTVRSIPGGTEVVYELDAEPREEVPGLLGRRVMAHNARDLLNQVRAEILRRGSATGAPSNSAGLR